jgi:hypothetical protein
MVELGAAFKCRLAPHHLFIIITTPDEEGSALVVNLTTHRDGEEDTACVLEPADYPYFIERRSIIPFRWANYGNVAPFEDENNFEASPAVSPETLKKIQLGGVASAFLRRRFQDVIRAEIGDMP